MNIQNFDGVETPDEALRRALRERVPVFIGVAMTSEEIRLILRELRDIVHEPSGLVIGRRQRPRR